LLDHWFETDAVIAKRGPAEWERSHRRLSTRRSRQRQLTTPHCTVSVPPTTCRGGRDRRQEKQGAIGRIFATVDSYAANFGASAVGHSALGTLDLDENLGLAGLDIFHDALGLDQLWAAATDVRLRRLRTHP
jgi:phytoene dehydrogenase-like protein